jgi:hypothetical protein
MNLEYQIEKAMGINSGLRNTFQNKYFPIVFSGNHPGYNDMLILPEDYERYNLRYPDSLIWIKELVNRSR